MNLSICSQNGFQVPYHEQRWLIERSAFEDKIEELEKTVSCFSQPCCFACANLLDDESAGYAHVC